MSARHLARSALALALAASAGRAQSLAPLVERFAPHDVDLDGTPEIEGVRALGAVGAASAPTVVVLVEERLLAARDGTTPARRDALRAGLDRYAGDLAAAGFRAELVAVACYGGARHQDGRTVLALRRLLNACRAAAPNLAGSVLVGHFPDALLVRSCNWRKREAIEIADRGGAKRAFPANTPFVRRVPEIVAHRCDLVLADLDGGWEATYSEPAIERPSSFAVFPDGVPPRGGVPAALQQSTLRAADAFHVADGDLTVDAATGAVTIDDAARDHECTAADRARGNPIARPDIAVSRIDARGVAWSPRAELLDAAGAPRAFTLGAGAEPPPWVADPWRPDADLELALLVEYFDRNHAYRSAPATAAAWKPASIAWGLGSGMREARAAAPAWHAFDEPGYDVTERVDLVALLAWLQRPAVFRTLRAHSDERCAVFAKTDAAALEQALGRAPWSWVRKDDALVPSLAAECAHGRAGFAFYRSLWQSRALQGASPYLLLHTGCEALSPPGATTLAYDDERYGRGQHAESMLFFTPCLAIAGRAKVFYDEPRGFSAALARGATFGDAWRGYFEIEANAADWDEAGGDIGRKRAYFWSVLGDWTLRLEQP